MGADIKALRTRIKSVNSTMHLTKAMGLVASSKIRRANDAMEKARAYEKTISSILDTLVGCAECARSPYLRTTESKPRTRLLVIAGDRGLAGGYNANVFRTVKPLIEQNPDIQILPIGKRACDRFGQEARSSEIFTLSDAYTLSKNLCQDFVREEYDQLGIVGTRYISMLTQEAYVRYLLPLSIPEQKKPMSAVFEPNPSTILNTAVLEYVAGCIFSAVRESFASEVSARRMAMDSAGKNASAMIDELQLSYNRARQSAITQEITEIIAGSGS
jgi:F-type H+-transporting ATPase subunit gamma